MSASERIAGRPPEVQRRHREHYRKRFMMNVAAGAVVFGPNAAVHPIITGNGRSVRPVADEQRLVAVTQIFDVLDVNRPALV
jgi:hypothetical protein